MREALASAGRPPSPTNAVRSPGTAVSTPTTSQQLPLGVVRDLLAGLRCPLLASVRGEDSREARVETALQRAGRRAIYAVVVEVEELPVRRGRRAR